MSNPKIIGRSPIEYGSDTDERADTVANEKVSVQYSCGAMGTASVQTFCSVFSEDRGGVVLKLEIEDDGSSMVPMAKLTDNGVELHLCGDGEATAMIAALKKALSQIPESSLDLRAIES